MCTKFKPKLVYDLLGYGCKGILMHLDIAAHGVPKRGVGHGGRRTLRKQNVTVGGFDRATKPYAGGDVTKAFRRTKGLIFRVAACYHMAVPNFRHKDHEMLALPFVP